MSDSDSDEEFFDCQFEPVKYYAVAYQKDKGKGIVTTDINEARNKLKASKGCRFTSFDDPLVAKRFAEKPLSDEFDATNKKKSSSSSSSSSQKKQSDPFPNVSPRELNSFKSAIEKGQLDDVKQIVRTNPRHLVTESDSPTLLQTRFRHNALHVAVSFSRADVVAFVLHVLGTPEFWHALYPTADEHGTRSRMHRVLDMYLNAPEVGNLETPLHLASKFGHRDCLRALLRQELTDTALRNKFGFRADEIVCQRYTDLFRDQRSQDMHDIFSEKYVVLLGSPEACRVLPPMSHCGLLELLRERNDEYRRRDDHQHQPQTLSLLPSSLDTAIATVDSVVRAYIGPVKSELASEICGRWITATGEDARQFGDARRADADKGMECHGRYLAAQFQAAWRELWPFLEGRYADLGTEEGLVLLDEHLGRIDYSVLSPPVPSPLESLVAPAVPVDCSLQPLQSVAPGNSSSTSGSGNSGSGGVSGLIRQFLRLTLGGSGSPSLAPSPISPVSLSPSNSRLVSPPARRQSPPCATMVTSTPLKALSARGPMATAAESLTSLLLLADQSSSRSGGQIGMGQSTGMSQSLRSARTPFNASVSGAGLLTPVDRQVRVAVGTRPRELLERFPRVSDWLHSLDEIDPILIPSPSPSLSAAAAAAVSKHFCPAGANGLVVPMSTPIRRRPGTGAAVGAASFARPGQRALSPVARSTGNGGPFKMPAPAAAAAALSKCLSPLSRIELHN